MGYYRFIRPLIYLFPPEVAHDLAVWGLRNSLVPKQVSVEDAVLDAEVFGIHFKNPVGLAAGFDKNADAVDALLLQGFGFVEVGTVTPVAQFGNMKPRLFRLNEDQAVINRFGFNNKGVDYFCSNLANRRKGSGVVGVNIGKNKNSDDSCEDYVTVLRKVYRYSDYITINISSPNTPGLRDLQNADELVKFFGKILEEKEKLVDEYGVRVPVLLKLAPDTSYEQRKDIAKVVVEFGVDGLVICNTSVGCRENLRSGHVNEVGGLSGRPVFDVSTQMVKDMYELVDGQIPIIGVGGIFSGDDAYLKIRAGASLVQLYSALVFEGFELVNAINLRLVELLKRDGFVSVSDAVGVDVG